MRETHLLLVILETEFRGHRFWPVQAKPRVAGWPMDTSATHCPWTPSSFHEPLPSPPQAKLGLEPLTYIHHQSSGLPTSLSKALWAEPRSQG